MKREFGLLTFGHGRRAKLIPARSIVSRDSEYNSQNIEVVDCNVSVVSVADLD